MLGTVKKVIANMAIARSRSLDATQVIEMPIVRTSCGGPLLMNRSNVSLLPFTGNISYRVSSYSLSAKSVFFTDNCVCSRATLCVSAVFAVARTVGLSAVRLSRGGVLYPQGWRYSQTFCVVWKPRYSNFFTQSADTQFRGEHLQRGRKIHGGVKTLRFSTEIDVYLGNGTR